MAQPKTNPSVPCYLCGKLVARAAVVRHAGAGECRARQAWNKARANRARAERRDLLPAGKWAAVLRAAGVSLTLVKGSISALAPTRRTTKAGATALVRNFAADQKVLYAPAPAVRVCEATRGWPSNDRDVRYWLVRQALTLSAAEDAVFRLGGARALVDLLLRNRGAAPKGTDET